MVRDRTLESLAGLAALGDLLGAGARIRPG
ncbi:MAG: hypothetical protein JWO59_421 [Chloroflexi bacterium]|nr:hypothetical protein [Chloroflexota bacterium]